MPESLDFRDATRPSSSPLTRPVSGTDVLLAIFLIPLIIAIGALMWRSTLMLPINFNEGWNAYWAEAAAHGHHLYLPWATFRANNYPPLSFYIIAAVTFLLPNAIYAGRLVAWIAFFGVGWAIYRILRNTGNNRTASFAGAALFYGYMVSQYSIYVGMDDPQMLAHLIVSVGLLILLRAKDRTACTIVAALVMALGLFIKHNIIALPAAASIWLFVYQRRQFLPFVLTLGGTGLAGLAGCQLFFGHNFLHDLFLPRTLSVKQGDRKLMGWLAPMQVLLILPALLQAHTLRDRYSGLFGIFALFSLILMVLQASGAGVNFNASFELVIALSLAGGHLLGRLGKSSAGSVAALRPYVTAAVAMTLFYWALARPHENILDIPRWVHVERTEAIASHNAVALISQRKGPAVCETLALCYWAGKRFEVSFFNLGQAPAGHNLSKAREKFLQTVRERQFSSIQTLHMASPRLRRQLANHYVVAYQSRNVGRIYIPN